MGWGRSIATPTSDSLVEAVYPSELDRLHEGAPELLPKPPPEEALARWMDLLVFAHTMREGGRYERDITTYLPRDT